MSMAVAARKAGMETGGKGVVRAAPDMLALALPTTIGTDRSTILAQRLLPDRGSVGGAAAPRQAEELAEEPAEEPEAAAAPRRQKNRLAA